MLVTALLERIVKILVLLECFNVMAAILLVDFSKIMLQLKSCQKVLCVTCVFQNVVLHVYKLMYNV